MDFRINMPPDVIGIIDTLYENGYEAYAVGGCVRDALLGREANDWDITTSAKPEQVKALFHRTIDTGLIHGTVTIMCGKTGYEVTTYRIDGEYEDARHPKEVIFTPNLVEDLKRRDFTINAMAYNDRAGLVDAFDGIGDLERHVIRCVGNPKDRFTEDALRMMRAVRFAAQLGFAIDPDTRDAVSALAPTIAKVSVERIHTELIKLLTSDHPEEIRTACELGLTGVFFPEFDRMMQTPQHNPHHCYSVGEHTIHAMQEAPADRILRLTMLFHDIAKPLTKSTDAKGVDHFYGHPEKGAKIAETVLKRWKLDNDTIACCCNLVRYHDYNPPLTEKNIRRAMNKVGTDNVLPLLAVKRADIAAQSDYQRSEKMAAIDGFEQLYRQIREAGQCVEKKNMAVTGRDLIAIGVKPGPRMGEIMEALFQKVLDDASLNEKDVLLEIVRKQYLG